MCLYEPRNEKKASPMLLLNSVLVELSTFCNNAQIDNCLSKQTLFIIDINEYSKSDTVSPESISMSQNDHKK